MKTLEIVEKSTAGEQKKADFSLKIAENGGCDTNLDGFLAVLPP